MCKSRKHDLNYYYLGTSIEKSVLLLSASENWLIFATFLGDI